MTHIKSTSASIWVIIPAAGVGARMAAGQPKQYIKIDDRSLIEITLRLFLNCAHITAVQVCIAPTDQQWHSLAIQHEKLLPVIDGGETRAHSVLAGLEALSVTAQPQDWVIVHDAARPCVSRAGLSRFIQEVADHPTGGLMAVPVADTLKQADERGHIRQTIARDAMWQAQTPQMFRFQALRQALSDAIAQQRLITDEASAMEIAGYPVKLIKGERANIKVTYPGDEHWVRCYQQLSDEL